MPDLELKSFIREIPDFPKPGINFKDITPLLADPKLVVQIVDRLIEPFKNSGVDVVAGIESRGFLFGMLMAQSLGASFVPIRKKGKLPFKTVEASYELEYGSATIEMHTDAFGHKAKVLIHDDLLATGGTAMAASQLITALGGELIGYSFVVELGFLKAREVLMNEKIAIDSLVIY